MSVQTAALKRTANPPASQGAKILRTNEGKAFAVLGTVVTFKDEPANNGVAVFAFENRMPPHTEHNHESFVILEGTFEFVIDLVPHRLGPGDFARVAPDALHPFRNVGSGIGRVQIYVSPGDQHRRFFEAVGQEIDDPNNPSKPSGPPDMDRVIELGRQSGIIFLRPAGH